ISSKASEFFHYLFVTTFNVFDIAYFCFAVGTESGNNQSGSCTQVGGFYRRRVKQFSALNYSNSSLNSYVGAHSHKLAHILVSVIPDAFLNCACSVNSCKQNCKLRLTVCRKSRVRHCLYITDTKISLGCV